MWFVLGPGRNNKSRLFKSRSRRLKSGKGKSALPGGGGVHL